MYPTIKPSSLIQTISYTAIALIAFAANSILCRLALGDQQIDAVSFTVLRLLSGIIMLMIILSIIRRSPKEQNQKLSNGSWISAVMLFLYAICFSFAYLSLDTGTGALILFGAVQLSIIVISLFSGTKLHFSEWVGIIIAFIGLVYLVLPDVSTPSIRGFALMSIAGIAWGVYTIRGKNVLDPLRETAFNFARTAPLLIGLIIVAFKTMPQIQISNLGILLAVLSGSLASGIGYMIWYKALRGLSSTEAAVVQLLVPVIAAIGGVIFVSEAITSRLVYSSIMILGGLLIVMLGRFYFVERQIKMQ